MVFPEVLGEVIFEGLAQGGFDVVEVGHKCLRAKDLFDEIGDAAEQVIREAAITGKDWDDGILIYSEQL